LAREPPPLVAPAVSPESMYSWANSATTMEQALSEVKSMWEHANEGS
jgi:hypothetical protein